MRGTPIVGKKWWIRSIPQRYLVLVIHRTVLGPASPEMSKTQLLLEER